MSSILQAVYRRHANPTISVPAPRDQDAPLEDEQSSVPHWYDHLASHAHETPFEFYQLPPVSMSSALDYPGADGYGVYNEYDLGNEDQPTRFGTAERLQRLCAILYANGKKPIIDWVPHQRQGGRNGVYKYKSASGQVGRFSKDPGSFMRRFPGDPGRVPRDPIAGPVADDFAFGDELCPINGVPKGYVLTGLIDAYRWLSDRIDAVGCRDDDTKGQAFEAVRQFARSRPGSDVVIGEYADGNRDTLAWWIRELNFRCHTYDFNVKYDIQRMCNNGSRFDMRHLPNVGMISLGLPYSMNSVTFLENADSDTNGFGSVVFNKLLGYAFLFTSEGWPSIYYRDYAQEHYCYGLKPHIDNLAWIHEHLVGGFTVWRHTEYQFAVMERLGFEDKPGALVGFNNDVWDTRWKHSYVQTHFGSHRHLHDYTGHAQDIWTDAHGGVDLYIPPNDNGAGYVVYAPDGYQGKTTSWPVLETTQVFEGAGDLDILPALSGKTTDVTRIWVAKEAEVRLDLDLLGAQPGPYSLVVTGPSHTPLGRNEIYNFGAREEGWYKIQMSALPSAPGVTPFRVRATYTSTKTLKGS